MTCTSWGDAWFAAAPAGPLPGRQTRRFFGELIVAQSEETVQRAPCPLAWSPRLAPGYWLLTSRRLQYASMNDGTQTRYAPGHVREAILQVLTLTSEALSVAEGWVCTKESLPWPRSCSDRRLTSPGRVSVAGVPGVGGGVLRSLVAVQRGAGGATAVVVGAVDGWE